MKRGGWLLTALAVGLTGGVLRGAEDDAKAEAANAKARMEAARKVYKGILARARIDPGAPLSSAVFAGLNRWSLRWMEAQRDLSRKKKEQFTAVEAHVKRMRELEKMGERMGKKGLLSASEVSAVTFYRLDAEKLLLKAKKKK
jgi:hypothetical protein